MKQPPISSPDYPIQDTVWELESLDDGETADPPPTLCGLHRCSDAAAQALPSAGRDKACRRG
jgi:hypothetical protein